MIDTTSQDNVRELDPFGFMMGQGSAIRPLGGETRGLDPRYVFHTPYVAFPPGRVHFTIRFDKLQASFGELRININAFVQGSGRDAMFVTSSRLYLADKPAVERGVTLSIMTVAGATYAVYGFCVDGTDARAAGLTITAEEIVAAEGSIAEELLLPTQLGSSAFDGEARLVGDAMPLFRDPVSQLLTEDQFAEPEYRRWTAALAAAPGPRDSGLAWKLAFAAQALDRYGMLQPGARGIALGQDSAALGPIMAAHKCTAMVASIAARPGETSIAWNSVPCSPIDAVPGPDGTVPGAPLSIADQPADERGFDFLWSVGLAGHGYKVGNAANFLIEAMAVLRPGGYAAHMFDLATAAGAPDDALPRADVERLAVTLISRGFSVAQLNFAGGATLPEPTVPFGLIVRKG